MSSLLIVDDEIRAVRGVLASLDWDAIGISPVYSAFSMKQAIAIMAEHPVDILVCDIEMPNGSGIDLLHWANENRQDLISILLTCHADFEYARQAVQLGVIEYLLKPVRALDLETAIQKAIKILVESRQQSETQSSFLHYFQLWSENMLKVEEHFWLDLLDGHLGNSTEAVRSQLQKIDRLELDTYQYQPVLMSIRGYPDGSDPLSRKAIIGSLRSEILSSMNGEHEHGQAIPIQENKVLALVACPKDASFDIEMSLDHWQAFIDAFKKLHKTDIACYCDRPSPIPELPARLASLLETDRNNVIWKHKVIDTLNRSVSVANVQIPLMSGWSELLSQGEQQKLIGEIRQTINAFAITEGFALANLREHYHNFMQIVYSVLQQKSVQFHDVFSADEIRRIEFGEIQSLEDLLEISLMAVNRIADHFKALRQSQTLIQQIKKYISDNIVSNPTREEIAARFFLHPDYLTRKFRKETGMTLSDYLAHERIRIAKDILINSSMPVSDIVSFVGYSNMSHFSKIFKKATGLNPLDYRKNKK